jgi:ABC-type lipoprotein export system ATPase subunit
MIEIKGLNKYYNKGKENELHVINNTTLQLPDTGLVCILGESGSGKTTLMNTVSGLDDFHDGEIVVDGTAIHAYGEKAQERVRNEKFGYIFQNYYLLQEQTVEYNIALGLSLYEITEEEKQKRIDYVLEAVDMRRFKKRLVSQLSGGQQQRIAIARALAKMPQVIFADEPTGNLDEANTMRIMSILKKASKQCLVVVVTHERSIADFFADRIIWILDGAIQKDELRSGDGVYHYADDNNIYLQEYSKQVYENENVVMEIYRDENESLPPVKLQLVYENDHLYVKTEGNANIDILTEDSEKQVIDGKRPVAEQADVEAFSYDLEPVTSTRIPKLSLRESLEMAWMNIRTLGKKQIFLIIALIAMSVLIVLVAQDMMTILNVDVEEAVSSDSNVFEATAEKNSLIDDEEYISQIQATLAALQESGLEYDLLLNNKNYLSYQYEGFWQLEGIEAQLENFTIVDVKHLSEDQLLYGRLPENSKEVVIDKWVLEAFLNEGGEISNVVNNIEHFLNKTIVPSNKDLALTIVGISDSGQPDIYVTRGAMISVSNYAESFAVESDYNNNNPAEQLTIETGTCYLSASLFKSDAADYIKSKYRKWDQMLREWPYSEQDIIDAQNGKQGEYYDTVRSVIDEMFEGSEVDPSKYTYEWYKTAKKKPTMDDFADGELTVTLKCGLKFTVAGVYEDGIADEDYLVSDEDYETILESVICKYKTFRIYSTEKEKVADYLKNNLPKDIASKVKYQITDSYETDMALYEEEKQLDFDARSIITITIFIISFIILYFMMKANAIARMQDLSVYRLLGIAKKSIVGLFVLENIMISLYTILPAVVVTTFITKLISGIEALEINIVFPWYAFVGTLLFLVGLTVLIGILPICTMLRKPPAQLASKYDI